MIDSLLNSTFALSINSGNSASGVSVNGTQVYGLLVFLAIIVTLRLYRGLNGRIYSTSRVLRTPIIYILITLFTVFFCWCDRIKVERDNLDQISQEYSGCLCQDCLESYQY